MWLATHKARFIAEVHAALTETTLQAKNYADHIFCIGTAITVVAAGQMGLLDTLGKRKCKIYLDRRSSFSRSIQLAIKLSSSHALYE